MGAWLKVDEKDKKVHYQVDPSWFKYTSEDEQKITLGKLSLLADVYRRAGYAINNVFKKHLWEVGGQVSKACDIFRGTVDPSEYDNYILVMLLLKYVSDVWLEH